MMISAPITVAKLPTLIPISRHLHLPRRNPNFLSPPPNFKFPKTLGHSLRSTESENVELGENPEAESGDGVDVEVAKVGRNRWRVQARIAVDATLEAVWNVLTDYEGLADFIPGLAVCKLLEKGEGFARLYQVGQQDLALGLKFEAKATLDCFEKEMEELPSGRRREIEFKMIDGDFRTFVGAWSILQSDGGEEGDDGGKALTFLSYSVELEPKLMLPVRLLEGRICREVKVNLISIRDRAQMLPGPLPS